MHFCNSIIGFSDFPKFHSPYSLILIQKFVLSICLQDPKMWPAVAVTAVVLAVGCGFLVSR